MSEPAADAAVASSSRPVRPDEEEYKAKLAAAEKEHAAVMADYNAVKAKIEVAQPSKNKDALSPTEQRRKELIAQSNEIRQKQAGGKSTRSSKSDQMKRLNEQLQSRIQEQKIARGRVAFKSAEEVDREIGRLDEKVNTGMMKLVDEKKALAEISNLRKQRKTFAQFDSQQAEIDDLKAKIKEIKDSMDDPEQKALSEEYNKIQAELNAIQAEKDEAYKGLSSLRDERTRLQNLQRELFQRIRKIRNDYFAEKKAADDYEWEAKRKARERRRAEDLRRAQEQKKERAQKMLAEAADPAYLDEIRRANSLIHFFDPTAPAPEKAPLLASSGLEAQASRQVEGSDLKGTKLLRKEDRDDEYLPAVAKGKKGKKNKKAAADAAKTFSCPPAVMEDCAFMGIDPPMSAADVPAAIEKVKAKLDFWKADQAAQTQRNIDKAKKEIEKLEAEEAAAEGGAPSSGVNGKSGEDDSVAKVAEDLQATTIEEKTEPAEAASTEEEVKA